MLVIIGEHRNELLLRSWSLSLWFFGHFGWVVGWVWIIGYVLGLKHFL